MRNAHPTVSLRVSTSRATPRTAGPRRDGYGVRRGCCAAATGFLALAGLAALRKTTRLRYAPPQTRFASQTTYASSDARCARFGSMLGRKTVHRERLCLYGRLPCGKRVLEVLTRRVHCGLISGLLMQSGHSSAAGPDDHSRGRCLVFIAGLLSPKHRSAFPTHGLTALPSLPLLACTLLGTPRPLFPQFIGRCLDPAGCGGWGTAPCQRHEPRMPPAEAANASSW